MDQPEQHLADVSGAGRWYSPVAVTVEDGKMYLLRVVVAEDEQPRVW
jgi:hypothetical protein